MDADVFVDDQTDGSIGTVTNHGVRGAAGPGL